MSDELRSVVAESGLSYPERSALVSLGTRIAPSFARSEPRAQAIRYVIGLLGGDGRRNSWRIAESAGETAPWATQRLLTRARWDADGVRDVVRDALVDRVAAPGAVLTLCAAAVPKRGQESVAVARQRAPGSARAENQQLAVYACYVSELGDAVVDRELFLPRSWSDDAARCDAARVPPERRRWLSVPHLGLLVAARTVAACRSVSWVRAGAAFGPDTGLRRWLEDTRVAYVADVPATTPVVARARGTVAIGALAAALPLAAWRHDAAGQGWAGVPVRLPGVATADAVHTALLRRSAGGVVTAHVCRSRPGVRLAQLVAVASTSRAADACLADAREHAGLDSYEVRTWPAWYRHVTLALLAAGCAPARSERRAAAA